MYSNANGFRRAALWRPVVFALVVVMVAVAVAGCTEPPPQTTAAGSRWLAGDHHIHSQYSLSWDNSVEPPTPILRSHGIYPIPHNALMASRFGLDWIVATDHGGRTHSKISMEQAYPSLLVAREAVPALIQFYGLELNPPGADHASIIVPRTPEESEQIFQVESRFDRTNGYGLPGLGPAADEEERMIDALKLMDSFAPKPLVIANHPSRTARGQGFGRTDPKELRGWNDAAPQVAIGMEGAPGHQASSLIPSGFPKQALPRGTYPGTPTRGGFDVMTAELGGVWDSMLGEGRKWWITATSDSHRHWSEGGNDFWPGEYSKTYVYAEKSYDDILQSLRAGRIFVTTGDLISELDLTVASGNADVSIGESMVVPAQSELLVSIRVRDPQAANHNGDSPTVQRIDLIVGDVNPALVGAAGDSNPSTVVLRRFTESDWTRDGEYLAMTHAIDGIDSALYLRVRGTSTEELEPAPDELGEDPWQDLWFYSNPVFVLVQPQ